MTDTMPSTPPEEQRMSQTTGDAPKPQDPMERMRQISHDYHVPISDGTIKSIIGEGAKTVDQSKINAFEEYTKTAAKGLFPTLAKQIDAGIPTAYLLDPYRQVGKQVLGEDFEPNFIGDPKSMMALHGGTDPMTGRPAPMDLGQWREHLMSHPGFEWDKTPAAHDHVNAILKNMADAFGKTMPIEGGR